MFYLVCLIILFIFYKTQRKICSQPTSLRKKLVIPTICLIFSIIGLIYVYNTVNHSHELKPYSQGNQKNQDTIITQTYNSDSSVTYTVTDALSGKVIQTTSISKRTLELENAIKVFLFFNIPTLVFTLFIFTGNIFLRLNPKTS